MKVVKGTVEQGFALMDVSQRAIDAALEIARKELADYQVEANASESELMIRVTVEAEEGQLQERAVNLVDNTLDKSGMKWPHNRTWTRVRRTE